MTKAKYATPEERYAAQSAKAKEQMRNQWAEKRNNEGTELGYYGCHRRVRKERGRAGDFICEENCGRQARHWSHIHETNPTDVNNYRALCQKCHWVYDNVGPRAVESAGPEGRSALARSAWSKRSPERRAEILRKAWETRRRNARMADPLSGDG